MSNTTRVLLDNDKYILSEAHTKVGVTDWVDIKKCLTKIIKCWSGSEEWGNTKVLIRV